MNQTHCSLQWRLNEHDVISNQPHDCLLNRLFKRRSKKTSKLRGTGLCVGNSPETGEFPTQRASNAENVSIWWRHSCNSLKVRKAYMSNVCCWAIYYLNPCLLYVNSFGRTLTKISVKIQISFFNAFENVVYKGQPLCLALVSYSSAGGQNK